MAEDRKKEKDQKKQDAIRKIGEVEKKMADNEMIDVTPGPRAQTRRLRRTKTFARLPCTEGSEGPGDADTDGPNDIAAKDSDISENEPPKKKTKPVKVSIRDSVNQYVEKERGEKAKKGRQEGGTSLVPADIRSDADDEEVVSRC
jgi:hypothetical protein